MIEQAKNRYGFIDAIRGVAACSVMLQHALYQSGLLGAMPLTGFIPTWLELGEVGVVAFFVVSGFVIPLSLEKTANFTLFWIHRALRIYPLYIFVFCVMILATRATGIPNFGGAISDIIASIFFIQEYIHQVNFVRGSWTLSIEIVWYLMISILFLVSIHTKTIMLVVAGIVASAIAGLICATGHHFPMGRLSMLMCCLLGLICYRKDRRELSLATFLTLFIAIITTIYLNIYVGDELFPDKHPTSTFKMASVSWTVAGLIFLIPFMTRKWSGWSHSGFSFLGRISYSVYLIHGIILYFVSLAGIHGVMVVLTTFVATIGLAVLSYEYIELPPIRYGHSFKPKSMAPVVAG